MSSKSPPKIDSNPKYVYYAEVKENTRKVSQSTNKNNNAMAKMWKFSLQKKNKTQKMRMKKIGKCRSNKSSINLWPDKFQ